MHTLILAALVPHPPILIPEVGGDHLDQVRATSGAMEQLAADVAWLNPDTLVLISPHGPVFRDAFAVHTMPYISGDLGAFGAPEVAYTFGIDEDLGRQVVREGLEADLPVARITMDTAPGWDAERLDHGTLVPLYFMRKAGWNGSILPVAVSFLAPVDLYAFGQVLQRSIQQSGRRVAVLASGDLSHRLRPGAPAGYHPEAYQFDREVVEALCRGDLAHLFRLDPDQCEQAGQCGLRPLMMLSGALDGLKIAPQVLSYEGPYGVGYAVASIRPVGVDPDRQLLPTLVAEREQRLADREKSAHPIVKLARAALEHYVRTGLEIDFSSASPNDGTTLWKLPPDLPEQAGVFVSLKVDGQLRGCIGTFEPTQPSLTLEVVRNAIKAGTQDPRFLPVEEEELPYLEYSVDVLGAPEPCTREQLDPGRYGVIVVRGGRRGLLLPDLPGVDTVDQQVEIACSKAGLDPKDPGLRLYRFEVRRFQ